MYDVFNMGCGFVVVVPAADEARAVEVLAARHPGTARIGTIVEGAEQVALPGLGLVATREDGVRSTG